MGAIFINSKLGNECIDVKREIRYKELHHALHVIDKKIKNELFNSDLSNEKFLILGFINKGLCQEYKFLRNEIFDENEAKNNIFNYNDLVKKYEKKNFKFTNPNFDFTFPSNFIFLNKDFLDVIQDFVDKNYKSQLQTFYKALIGGGCLILGNPNDIKDESPFRYIVLYHEINENQGNEIDFILYIKDKNNRNKAELNILKYDLWTYFKKIKYDYREEYRRIYNDKKQQIGYIIRCTDVFRIETYISGIASLKQHILKSILKNINSDIKFDEIVLFLFQIEQLKNFLSSNKNIDFADFKNIILNKIELDKKNFQTYDKIFEELLTKLDPNKEIDIDYYNQALQYDEEKGLEKFMKKNNIIRKLFYIPKEEIISCKKCGMNTFKFNYSKYILIQNQLNEFIFQKIFGSEIEYRREKSCTFCNGLLTDVIIERKSLDFPEILIVIISPSLVNYFQITHNVTFTNGKIMYKLNKFIESTNNCLYLINIRNIMICNKFEKGNIGPTELIENKKPIVLFYKLINNPIIMI